MALNDLIKTLGFGLILAACGSAGESTPAGGCKDDSECKGNRVCIDGECVEESRNLPGKDTYNAPGKDTYSALPDTFIDTSQNLDSIKYQDSFPEASSKDIYDSTNFDTVINTDTVISDAMGCSKAEFTCDNGKCIPKSYVCDGKNDCSKGEDEKGCYVLDTWTPTDTLIPTDTYCEWPCNNGECIPQSYVCDGENDCSNGEDEKGCCQNECEGLSACIDSSSYVECKDINGDGCTEKAGSPVSCPTEAYCEEGNFCKCMTGYFTCAGGNQCISSDKSCDGQPDCSNESDEGSECTYTCNDMLNCLIFYGVEGNFDPQKIDECYTKVTDTAKVLFDPLYECVINHTCVPYSNMNDLMFCFVISCNDYYVYCDYN